MTTSIETLGDRPGEATTLEALGSLEKAQGHDDRALTFFQRALAMYQQLGDTASADEVKKTIAGLHAGPSPLPTASGPR